MIPSAARRSANGSRDPVGFSPIAKNAASVSILSASATTMLIGRGRAGVARAERLVMLGDRVGDRAVFAVIAARNSGP